jgi:mannitol/fructose-specific phosphotransferase system IIA component
MKINDNFLAKILEFANFANQNPNFVSSEKFKEFQNLISKGITFEEYEAAMLDLNKMQSSFLGKMNEVKKATE